MSPAQPNTDATWALKPGDNLSIPGPHQPSRVDRDDEESALGIAGAAEFFSEGTPMIGL